jgi:carboxymethylenebutenolidase
MSKKQSVDQRFLDLYDRYAHGFHNDTTPRFDEESAELAWRRTVEFFRLNLV